MARNIWARAAWIVSVDIGGAFEVESESFVAARLNAYYRQRILTSTGHATIARIRGNFL